MFWINSSQQTQGDYKHTPLTKWLRCHPKTAWCISVKPSQLSMPLLWLCWYILGSIKKYTTHSIKRELQHNIYFRPPEAILCNSYHPKQIVIHVNVDTLKPVLKLQLHFAPHSNCKDVVDVMVCLWMDKTQTDIPHSNVAKIFFHSTILSLNFHHFHHLFLGAFANRFHYLFI